MNIGAERVKVLIMKTNARSFFVQFKFSGCVIRTEHTSFNAVVKRYVKRFQLIVDPSSDRELISSLQIKRKSVQNNC